MCDEAEKPGAEDVSVAMMEAHGKYPRRAPNVGEEQVNASLTVVAGTF